MFILNRKTLFTFILLTTSIFASNLSKEFRGDWWVSHYDVDKKISFLNITGYEIHIKFLSRNKIDSKDGYLKNMGYEFQVNNIVFGKMIDGKVKYNKSIYKIFLDKEYIDGQVCYKIKPIKLNSGYFTKKDIFKLCREERKYLNKTY